MTRSSSTVAFPTLARRVRDEATTSTEVIALLKRLAPNLVAELELLAAHPAVLRVWGESRNFDENARRIIVKDTVLAAIGALASVPCEGPVVHAGLLHTYGYLLSTIRTPYGFKRTRWLRPDLERGLGLAPGLLRPSPREGTLLGNLTAVLCRLLAATGPCSVPRSSPAITPQTLTGVLPKSRLSIVERVVEADGRDVEPLILRTELIPLTGGQSLLLYAAGSEGSERLITAFPLSAGSVQELATQEAGRRVALRVRYNAAAREWPPLLPLFGTRRIKPR